jgi:hypothetical protein
MALRAIGGRGGGATLVASVPLIGRSFLWDNFPLWKVAGNGYVP